MKKLLVFVFAVVLFVGCGPEAPKEPVKVDYPENVLNDKNFQSINQLGKLVGTWKVQSKQVKDLNWLFEIYKVEDVYTIAEITSECTFIDADKENDEREGCIRLTPDYDVNETGLYYRIRVETGSMTLFDNDGSMRSLYKVTNLNYDPSLL